MEVSKKWTSFSDSIWKIIFLNIHMESIQKDIYIFASNSLTVLYCFLTVCHNVSFKSVKNFQTALNIKFFSNLGNFFHAFNASFPCALFVIIFKVFAWPVRIHCTNQRFGSDLCHRSEDVCKIFYSVRTNCRVFRSQIVFFSRSDIGSDLHSKSIAGIFQFF